MPSTAPQLQEPTAQQLGALGLHIRLHRKALHVSAASAAEAAGMSRVTLHRIEKGEPSVTMGAYLNAMTALGLGLEITKTQPPGTHTSDDKVGWIPAIVRIGDYPQLQQLAWQVHGTDTLTPREAWDIYARNERHIDKEALQPQEQQLMDALRIALGTGSPHV